MRYIARRAVAAAAVAATALALTMPPASANPGYILNGGSIEGTNVGDIVGYGLVNGTSLVCKSLEVTGYTPVVNGPTPGTTIATITSATFSSPGEVNDWCVVNGSIPTKVTALSTWTGAGLWPFIETGSASGITDGRLNGVAFELDAPSIPCRIVVGGPSSGGSGGFIEAAYTNPSTLTGTDGTLSIPLGATNSLSVLSAFPGFTCYGLLSVGETVALIGDIQVNRTGPVPPPAGISPTINP